MIMSEMHPVVAQASVFTEVYKQYRNEHVAVREAMCLKTQYPALMGEIAPGDLFAGSKAEDRITYLGTIWWAMFPDNRGPGKQGGYCFDFDALERYGHNPVNRAVLENLTEFWREECTWSKIRGQLDQDSLHYILEGGQIAGGGCGFVVAPDLDRLLTRGIPGLLSDIAAREKQALKQGEDVGFLKGLALSIETLIDVCRHYQEQATLVAASSVGEEKVRLQTIAATLDGIVEHAPGNLREAIQLLWLYCLLTSGMHPEAWRLDVALGDFYVRDLDEGTLTEEEAVALILGLWQKFTNNGSPAVCRVLIGGKGRRNEENADRFALAAMEATRRHYQVTPQLTLRFHEDQDPRLMSKAFDVLGEGCVFPMLYNDEVVVPGVAKALAVSEEEALNYHPLGCGEYMIAGSSPSLLNFVWSIPKSLEAAMGNGVDCTGKLLGPATGDTGTLTCFEDLYEAFLQQIGFAATLPAQIHAKNCEVLSRECSFLFASLLTDDCLKANRPLLDGGVRHKGACIMGHGFTNTADSLVAIRHLVFEQKEMTLKALTEALADNFEEQDDLRKRLLAYPKFGNDEGEVDAMLVKAWQDINIATARAGQTAGLDFLTVSSVNPGGYGLGSVCGATADGRRRGMPFAIGNAPAAGQDKRGITAFLNSVAKVDPANGGATTNVKLSRTYFSQERPKLDALFEAFFKQGGMQATVTVVNQQDLEAAIVEPEKYPNLLVRVGGWSARFIDLEPEVQKDILLRTAY